MPRLGKHHPLEPSVVPGDFDIGARFDAEQASATTRSIRMLEDDFYRAVPWRKSQIVMVTLPETAHTNIVVHHTLTPANPDAVKWKVVGWELTATPGEAPYVYRLVAVGEPAWSHSAIVLRSNMTTGRVHLELSVPGT